MSKGNWNKFSVYVYYFLRHFRKLLTLTFYIYYIHFIANSDYNLNDEIPADTMPEKDENTEDTSEEENEEGSDEDTDFDLDSENNEEKTEEPEEPEPEE